MFSGSTTTFARLCKKGVKGSKYYIKDNKPSIAFTILRASYLYGALELHNLQMSNIHFADGNTKAQPLILNVLVSSEGLWDRDGQDDQGWWDREEIFGECSGEIKLEIATWEVQA